MYGRVLIGAVWAYFAWYGWSVYAGLAGVDPRWGPVLALSGVALVLALRIWVKPEATDQAPKPVVSTAGDLEPTWSIGLIQAPAEGS
jgi:hypothetical protein